MKDDLIFGSVIVLAIIGAFTVGGWVLWAIRTIAGV